MTDDYFLKTLRDIAGPVAYGVTGAFIAAVTSWWNSRTKGREKNFVRDVIHDNRIYELLAELRVQTGATRAYLTKYHNGSEYLDDQSIMRKTRTHEVTRLGTTYQQAFFTDVPVSAFPSETKLVLDEGHSFTKVADLPEDRFKSQCIAGFVAALARCAVTKNGKLVGFVGLDFDVEDPPCPENLDLICEYAHRIVAIQSEKY